MRWTGGLANMMMQTIVRVFVLACLLLTALLTVGTQAGAAQSNEGSGGFKGVLWEDSDKNGERSSAEQSLAGMIIVLYSIDPPGDDEVDRAVTGLDGRYAFEGLPGGRYDVRVEISSGTSAGTVSGAGVEGRWLSELTTEDWDLGLIRHDPSLPPRSDPVPPPQVSVEAIAVERPAASAPTSESVPTDTTELEVLAKIELNAGGDDVDPLLSGDTTTSVPLPPRIDPTPPTTVATDVEVAAATTLAVPATDAPATAPRVESTLIPGRSSSSSSPASSSSTGPTPTLIPPPTTRTDDSSFAADRLDGETALGPGDGVATSPRLLDDRAMVFVTAAALAMTGLALLTGTRRRRQDLS